MNQIDGKMLVNDLGVKEFWVWSTDFSGDEPSFNENTMSSDDFRAIAESNMASPTGNVSNSYRHDDLPIYNSTYTVYQFNLHRGVDQNIHNHILSLGDFVLLCDGVSDYNSTVSQLPCTLLEQSIVWYEGRARLRLRTENGNISISCGKVRLFNKKSPKPLVG